MSRVFGPQGDQSCKIGSPGQIYIELAKCYSLMFQLIDSFIHSFIQSVIHSCVDELPFSFIICPNYINARKLAVNLAGCRLKGDVTNCVKFVSPAVKGCQQKNHRLPKILGPCLYTRCEGTFLTFPIDDPVKSPMFFFC